MSLTAENIRICNAALTRAGMPIIEAYSDGSTAALVAETNYQMVVDNELASPRWKFCRFEGQLNRLEDKPLDAFYAYAYQLPANLLQVVRVTQNGCPVAFDRQRDQLWTCVLDEPNRLVAIYTLRVDEVQWPGDFREAIIQRMEAIFLRGLGERAEEAAQRDRSAEGQFQKARTADAQARSPRDPWRSALVRARRG